MKGKHVRLCCGFWFAILLGILVGVSVADTDPRSTDSPQARLSRPVVMNWPAQPFIEGLRDLAGDLDVPYILDAHITEAQQEQIVRIHALHLNGRQALRSLARAVGLSAVFVQGTVLIAPAERLPKIWQRTGSEDGAVPIESDDARLAQALRTTTAIQWPDVPLQRVAQDVSTAFPVDLIFEKELVKRQDLIHFIEPEADLRTICQALAEQLTARLVWREGAIWVQAAEDAKAVEVRLDPEKAGQPPEDDAPHDRLDPWDRVIELSSGTPVPQGLAEVVHLLPSPPSIEVRMDAPGSTLSALGTVREILEAGRLAGYWGNP